MQTTTRDHVRTYHLHRLATTLDELGFDARVKTTYPPALYVFIPGVSMLTETIDCRPATDDEGRLRWFYRWSWGDVLGDTDDPAAAAEKVAEVLAAR
jgi:hypothetical protein